MAWTNEQLQAIEKSGTNIIVSAGAGSGKTAVLSTRVIHKLKQGIHINELLILTFTNAAAAEMKERIKNNIKKEQLTEELNLLDSSYITTFDSYSLSIVKKYHYLLNLDQHISITENTILELLKKQVLTETLEKYYQKSSPEFTNLINTLCSKNDDSLKDELLSLINKLDIRTDRDEYLNNYINTYYSPETIEWLIKTYQTILTEKIDEIKQEIDANQAYFETNYLTKLNTSLSPLYQSQTLDELLAKIKVAKLPMLPKASEEETKEAKEKINNNLKKLKELTTYGNQEEIINNYYITKDLIKEVISILKDFFYTFDQIKKTQNIFDFTDIAKMALQIIKQNPDIKQELQTNFKEIMVDEYQDTSDIQEEFISLISNNNVYMVGDIKQSIYRFRNANPNIFRNKYDQYSKQQNGLKIDLLKNFRSRFEVLDNINQIFNKIMDNKIGNAEYRDTHQMIFGNTTYIEEGKTNQNYNMDILIYNPENSDYTKDEIEIFSIANDIKNKITNHYQIFDKDQKILKPITYQDFCIIMDRNSTFDLTKKIFEYMGIPLSLYKDEELNDSIDIFLIKNILTLLIKIKDKIYDKEFKYCFTSIARSFLYRLPDEEIFQYIQESNEKNSPIIKDLSPLISQINILSIPELLEKILIQTHFYQQVIEAGNIKESMARMEKIINLAQNISSLNYDIYDFQNYLNELLTQNQKIKFNLGVSSSNSVKIMNIHKSKGLEFPICYFCGLYKTFSKKDFQGDIIYEPGLPISIPLFKDGLQDPITKLIIKDKVSKDDISEKIRLFYVALTRAKEKIILLLPTKDNLEERSCENGVIENNVRYLYNSIADMLYSIPNVLSLYKKNINLNELNLTKEYLIPKNITSTKEKSQQQIQVQPINIEVSEITKQNFSKKIIEPIEIENKRNIDFGNKIHHILEFFDFKNPNLDIIEDNFIKKIIQNLLNSTPMQNIDQAEIYQEYEFYENVNNIENHGIIDLLLIFENHITIIDYKLNNIIDENYQKQILGYKNYIQKLYSKPVNCYLYSLLTSEIKTIH